MISWPKEINKRKVVSKKFEISSYEEKEKLVLIHHFIIDFASEHLNRYGTLPSATYRIEKKRNEISLSIFVYRFGNWVAESSKKMIVKDCIYIRKKFQCVSENEFNFVFTISTEKDLASFENLTEKIAFSPSLSASMNVIMYSSFYYPDKETKEKMEVVLGIKNGKRKMAEIIKKDPKYAPSLVTFGLKAGRNKFSTLAYYSLESDIIKEEKNILSYESTKEISRVLFVCPEKNRSAFYKSFTNGFTLAGMVSNLMIKNGILFSSNASSFFLPGKSKDNLEVFCPTPLFEIPMTFMHFMFSRGIFDLSIHNKEKGQEIKLTNSIDKDFEICYYVSDSLQESKDKRKLENVYSAIVEKTTNCLSFVSTIEDLKSDEIEEDLKGEVEGSGISSVNFEAIGKKLKEFGFSNKEEVEIRILESSNNQYLLIPSKNKEDRSLILIHL